MSNTNLEQKDNGKKDEKAWWQPALVLFAKFSGWIVFPVIIAIYFGSWLDKKFNSKPIFFLGIVGLAFFISMFGLVKNVLEENKRIEKEEKEKKEKSDKNNIKNF